MVAGLLLGILSRRFVSITVFLILMFTALKTLEALGFAQSWPVFYELKQHLVGTGKTTIQLFTDLLNSASVFGGVLFLVGGVSGILWRRKGV